MLKFQRLTGVELQHVPFEGSAPARAALLGGHVDVGVINAGEAIPYAEEGKVTLLGQMADERWEGAPDVPTFKEQGYDLVSGSARGIAAPAGTPQEYVDALAAAIEQAVMIRSFARRPRSRRCRCSISGRRNTSSRSKRRRRRPSRSGPRPPGSRASRAGPTDRNHATGTIQPDLTGRPQHSPAPGNRVTGYEPMKIVELAVALVILVLAALGLVDSLGFPRASAYLPTTVLGLTCALCLAWAAQSVLAMRRERPTLRLDPAETRRLLTLAVLSLLYALAIVEIGFFTSTSCSSRSPRCARLSELARLVMLRRPLRAVLYAVFGLLLQTPLPPS